MAASILFPGAGGTELPSEKLPVVTEQRDTWHIQIPTPLGPMCAVATDEALVLLEFQEERRVAIQTGSLGRYISGPQHESTNPVLDNFQKELHAYFHGEIQAFTVPTKLYGTEFQKLVWRHLLAIQYGQTATYAQVARSIEKRDASRAVGKANGDNRIAIVVPCHRVIRADGHMCGYGGGLWRKQYLLALESGQPLLL